MNHCFIQVHAPLARYNSPSSAPHGSSLPLVPRASTPYPPFSTAAPAHTPLHSPAYNHATDFDSLMRNPTQSGGGHRLVGSASFPGHPYRPESAKNRMQFPMGPPAPRQLPELGHSGLPIMSSPRSAGNSHPYGFRANIGRDETGYQQVNTRQRAAAARYAGGHPSPLTLSGGAPF